MKYRASLIEEYSDLILNYRLYLIDRMKTRSYDYPIDNGIIPAPTSKYRRGLVCGSYTTKEKHRLFKNSVRHF